MDDMIIICADCNSVLPNQEDKCKKCGSPKKVIKLFFVDAMPGIHECIHFKAKDKTKNSRKNPILDVFQGNEIYKRTGEWVNKEREIDKTNNRYHENVETLGGKILHHCDEKLTDHRRHGSAKIKSKK